MIISVLDEVCDETFSNYERDDLDSVLRDTSGASNVRLSEMFEKWDMRKLDELVKGIVNNGRHEMPELCKKNERMFGGCGRCDFVMGYAASCGHVNITRLCKKWGANNFDEAIDNAARSGHIEIVESVSYTHLTLPTIYSV